MFQPGTTIAITPKYKKIYFKTYKVNHVTQDGNYDLTELNYKTLEPILDENNYENNIIANKDYIEREFQPLILEELNELFWIILDYFGLFGQFEPY